MEQNYKVIFFDMGEVVFTNDWHYECPEKFAAYTKHFGITYDQMEKGWNVAWPLYELGKVSEDKFWEIFLKNAGAKIIDVDVAKKLWRKYFGKKPGMLTFLTKLRKKYKLAVLSSTGKEWMEYKVKKYHLDSYFSDYITTYGTGLSKRHKKIYYFALKKVKYNAEECLLIDDSKDVQVVANKCGIKTILFKNPKQLEKDLMNLNII